VTQCDLSGVQVNTLS